MPTYLHKCPNCGQKFEKLRLSINDMNKPVTCPECQHIFTGNHIPQKINFSFTSGLPSYDHENYGETPDIFSQL